MTRPAWIYLAFWVGLASASGSTGTEVPGIVVDHEDQPIAGASIEATLLPDPKARRGRPRPASRFLATTDEFGLFELGNLPPGSFDLLVRAEGYAPRIEERIASDQASLIVELAQSGAVRGRVLGADGSALSDAKVMLKRYRLFARSGADGAFLLSDVPLGTATLEVRARGHKLETREIRVMTPEAAADAGDFRLSAANTASGLVLDAEGQPVADAQVQLQPADRSSATYLDDLFSEGPEDWSDPEGRFLISEVAPQREFQVLAAHPDFAATSNKPFRLELGESRADLRLILRPGATVAGVARGPEERPIADAQVWLQQPDEFLPLLLSPAVTSSESGTFSIDHVPAGKAELTAQAEGWRAPDPMPLQLRDGQTIADLQIRFEKGLSLSGLVVDPAGAPIGGAEVEALGSRTRKLALATSDSDGRFELRGLPEGDIGLRATATGFAQTNLQSSANRTDVVIRMQPAGILEVLVTQIDGGAAVCDAAITVDTEIVRYGRFLTMSTSLSGRAKLQEPCSEGLYRTDELLPAVYQLHIAAPGLATQELSGIEVRAGAEPNKLKVVMGPGRAIRGTVVRKSDEEPLAAVRVVAQREASGEFADDMVDSALSDERGRFLLPNLAAGRYRLVASHPLYVGARLGGIEVGTERDTTGIELICEEGGWIEGTVYGAGGRPQANARVTVAGPILQSSLRTDDEGFYRSPPLQPGLQRIHTMFEFHQVEVVAGRATVQDFGRGGVKVHGRVIDAYGPLANVKVQFMQFSPAGRKGAEVLTDVAGVFPEIRLEPGEYGVNVRPAETRAYGGRMLTVSIPEVEAYELELRVPAGRILARVVNSAGDPVDNIFAHIELVDQEEQPIGQLVQRSGEIEFRRLPAGDFVVSISADGYAEKKIAPIGLGEDQILDLGEIRLGTGGEIEILVADVAGTLVPLAHAAVISNESYGNFLATTRTDNNGRGTIRGLEDGRYTLVAADGRLKIGRSAEVSVSRSRPAEAQILLLPGAQLLVTVLGMEGEPVQNAQVGMLDERPSPVILATGMGLDLQFGNLTDQFGRTRIEGILPGTYEVSARWQMLRGKASVTLASGAEQQVEIHLGPNADEP